MAGNALDSWLSGAGYDPASAVNASFAQPRPVTLIADNPTRTIQPVDLPPPPEATGAVAELGWNPYTQPVDVFYMALTAGKTAPVWKPSPGIAELTQGAVQRRYQEAGQAGWSGALVLYHGMDPVRFVFNVKLYTPRDWADWHAFASTFLGRPKPRERPPAWSIQHPLLDVMGVSACVVESVDAPLQSESAPGEWVIAIRFIESRPLTIAPVKPRKQEPKPAANPYEAVIKAKAAREQYFRDHPDTPDDELDRLFPDPVLPTPSP